MPSYEFSFDPAASGLPYVVRNRAGETVDSGTLESDADAVTLTVDDLPFGVYEAKASAAGSPYASTPAFFARGAASVAAAGGGFDETGDGPPATDPTTVDPGYTYLDTTTGALYMVFVNPNGPVHEWSIIGGEIDGTNEFQGVIHGNGLSLLGKSLAGIQTILTDVDGYAGSGLGVKWIGTGIDGQQGLTVDAGSGGISLNTTDGVYVNSLIRADGPVGTKSNAAPANGAINANELYIWFDSTNGASKVMFKGKSADGTVVSGNVALS